MDSSRIGRQWNEVYDSFDYSRSSVWREEATFFFVKQIPLLKKKSVKKILDAGCGDGRNAIAFAKAGFEVTGIDLSQSALDKCRENCKSLFQELLIVHQIYLQ